jgi:glycosyltransferase involved in cell wall biosynthesis
MNVLYDHQAFTGHMYGGVARYFYELMRSFDQNHPLTFDLSLVYSNNEYIKGKSFAPHRRYEAFAQNRMANRTVSLLNRMHSIERIRSGKFDLFHPTYYHKYFLEHLGSKPFVLTFHDATSERYAHRFPDIGTHLTDLKKKLLQRADRIIAVSEFSKQELHEFFGTSLDRIDVIHLGTSLGDESTNSGQTLDANRQTEPFPYLLYVGKRAFYKNFDLFFAAIQPMLHRHPDIRLVCAGGGVFSREEQNMFRAAGLANRVHFRPITDASLFRLYEQALAFVFPSLNEGFGIPVLEAFSANCPAVLSNRSSLPEVGGSAAVYFDPENTESIASAVEKVVFNETLRAELSQRGRERLRLFSCEKTAGQTLSIYQSFK